VRTTIATVFETSTCVRLFGFPSNSPIVPSRSSRAIAAEPIETANPARTITPYDE
jgi:hypothetical protein